MVSASPGSSRQFFFLHTETRDQRNDFRFFIGHLSQFCSFLTIHFLHIFSLLQLRDRKLQLPSKRIRPGIRVSKLLFQSVFHFFIICFLCIPVFQRLLGKYFLCLFLFFCTDKIFQSLYPYLKRHLFPSACNGRKDPAQTGGSR